MKNISAQLILATGSRAGMVAEIHSGYYMIGRDRVCQIRPKSRSVSRKHCLLHWEIRPDSEARFRIFDLDSSAGTRVNGTRVPTRTWIELVDGAELRCGKIAFDLAITAGESTNFERLSHVVSDPASRVNDPSHEETVSNDTPFDTETGGENDDAKSRIEEAARNGPTTPENLPLSLLQGEAWQEVDIASFLEAEDNVAREARYDDIRSKTTNHDALASDSGFLDSDDGFIDDDAADASDQTPSGRNAGKSRAGPGMHPSTKLKSAAGPSVFKRIDWDKVKIYAAFVMTIAVFVFGGYQALQFWQGPEVRIVDGID